MHRPETSVREYLRCLVAHARGRLWVSAALTTAVGLLEAGALLILPVMLPLVGLGSASGLGGVGRAAAGLFSLVHLPMTLLWALAAFVAAMGFQAWIRVGLDVLNTRIESDFTCFLRERLYSAMVDADWLFFTRQRSSDLVQVFTEELQRVGLGTQQLLALAGMAGVAAVQLAVAFVLSPGLTALALACGAGLALALRPFARRVHEMGRTSQEKRSAMAAAVSEHLGGMKVAKSHGWEARHVALFGRIVRDIASQWVATVRVQARARLAFELGAVAAMSAFLYCAVEVARAEPARLLMLAFIFTRMIPRMVAVQGSWQRVMQALPSFEAAERLRGRFLAAGEGNHPGAGERRPFDGEVRLESVSFAYSGEAGGAALTGVDLSIPARGITAVCGPSGAGKSTLADLLLGLLRPTAGRVLVDGEPLAGARLQAWRQSVGYVPQETFLFHDTIRSNLAVARPGATEAEIRAALRAAAAEELVDRLPLGLDAVVGDRGMRVSGGERQRLALARALLRRPALLVLDEATSALDTENERLVQRALDGLRAEMSIVIIAHRLSTVRIADRIIVLRKGRVAEEGGREELGRRASGVFAQLAADGGEGLS